MAGPQMSPDRLTPALSQTQSIAPGALWPLWQKGILSAESFRLVDHAHLLGHPRGSQRRPVPSAWSEAFLTCNMAGWGASATALSRRVRLPEPLPSRAFFGALSWLGLHRLCSRDSRTPPKAYYFPPNLFKSRTISKKLEDETQDCPPCSGKGGKLGLPPTCIGVDALRYRPWRKRLWGFRPGIMERGGPEVKPLGFCGPSW